MKKLVWVNTLIIITVLIFRGVSTSASESRLLKEIVSDDQQVKYVQSRPVIISHKHYRVVISPKSILIEPKASIKFTMAIHNLHQDPFHFSLDSIQVYSGEKAFPLLKQEAVIAEARKEYSVEKLKLNKEQEKILAPFVEDKMQQLRDELLKDQTINSKRYGAGLIAIDVPLGIEKLTIKVTTPRDTHKFLFNLFEL